MGVELYDQLAKQKTKHPVLEVHLSGKLEAEDYKKFVPQIEAMIKEHGKIRILVYLNEFSGWTLQALWNDIGFDFKHFSDIAKLAIVGESKFQEAMTAFCRPFTTAQIRYFDHGKLPDARQWIDAP